MSIWHTNTIFYGRIEVYLMQSLPAFRKLTLLAVFSHGLRKIKTLKSWAFLHLFSGSAKSPQMSQHYSAEKYLSVGHKNVDKFFFTIKKNHQKFDILILFYGRNGQSKHKNRVSKPAYSIITSCIFVQFLEFFHPTTLIWYTKYMAIT